jgi:DNA-binding XRE family transcriptional regulator
MADKTKKKTIRSGALQHAFDRYVGKSPESIRQFEEEVVNAEIAGKVYDLRIKAGFSQRELAKRVGTSASAICRIEDADYEGHSLYLLKRIAEALDQRVEIRFVPVRRKRPLLDVGVR